MKERVENAPPPKLHLRILEERERALANGETKFVDWEEAIAEILRRTSHLKK